MIRRYRLDDEHPLPPVLTDTDLAAARALYADQLLACPFCAGNKPPADGRSLGGYAAPWIELDPPRTDGLSQYWRVQCRSCNARTASERTAALAVASWNRRCP